jgi:hypothetical protein
MAERGKFLIVLAIVVMIFGILGTDYVLADNDSGQKGNSDAVISGPDSSDNENNADANLISGRENADEIKNAMQDRNRLRFENKTAYQCPAGCWCTKAVIKCNLNGTRQMMVYANSGNTIIQSRGMNASANVTIYKQYGKVYASSDNSSTAVNFLPDEASERAAERLKIMNENLSIQLRERVHKNIPQVVYNIEANKSGKFLGIFRTSMKVGAEVDPSTGEVLDVNKPWWSFLVAEQNETQGSETGAAILGESCGTVTPGENDACCQTKGYDYWNSTNEDCEYNLIE